jgi:hypothetical protein
MSICLLNRGVIIINLNVCFNEHDIWSVLCVINHCRDRMVFVFMTTYAVSAYHHKSCEFEPRSWRDVLDTTSCDEVCQWFTTAGGFKVKWLESQRIKTYLVWLVYKVESHFQQYFSYIVAVSFIGGENNRHVPSHWQTLPHNVVNRSEVLSGYSGFLRK